MGKPKPLEFKKLALELYREGKSNKEIAAHFERLHVSERTVQRWTKSFDVLVNDDLNPSEAVAEAQSRSKPVRTPQNILFVRLKSKSMSGRRISRERGISETTVRRIIKEDLKLKVRF